MPNITLTFPNPINVSVQVGDIAYYLNNSTNLGTHTHSNQGDIIQIGDILEINQNLFQVRILGKAGLLLLILLD